MICPACSAPVPRSAQPRGYGEVFECARCGARLELPRRDPLLGYATIALGGLVAWALGASTLARFLIITLAATIVLLVPMAILAQALFPTQPKLAGDFTTLGLSDTARPGAARQADADPDADSAAVDARRAPRHER